MKISEKHFNGVVIIRINDDNYATKDCFIADDLQSALHFIADDAEIDFDELDDWRESAVSKDCVVFDFDDLVYRIHLKPEKV